MAESSPLEAAAKAAYDYELRKLIKDGTYNDSELAWHERDDEVQDYWRAVIGTAIAAYEAKQTTPDPLELTEVGIEAWATYRYEHRGEVGMDLAAFQAFTAAVLRHLKGEAR